MPAAVATLTPLVPSDDVTAWIATFVQTPAGSTTPNAPIILTFALPILSGSVPTNVGDTTAVFVVTTNADGNSLQSPTVSAVCPSAPPTTVPTTPGVTLSFTFP